MTGTLFSRCAVASAIAVVSAMAGGCPAPRLSLEPELLGAARWNGARGMKAAAWLLGPGQIRVNIEPEPDLEGSCGVSIFIAESDPERAKLEIRCPAASGKGLPGESGAMGSLFEKSGSSVLAWACVLMPGSLDFSVGEETENSGCFVAETAEKKVFKGCFVTTGLFAAETPKRLKPITK